MQSLAARQTHEIEVKKSRFAVVAEPVDSPEAALERIAAVRVKDATHNCWAYRIGDRYRFSDDGEPGGTAGRPILAAIEAQGIDRVVVVVTRWFGGIKLGAGGLARAYGGAAAECLRIAAKLEIRELATLEVTAPFETIGAIYPLLDRFDAAKLEEDYGETGVALRIEIDQASVPEFERALADATRGQASCRVATAPC